MSVGAEVYQSPGGWLLVLRLPTLCHISNKVRMLLTWQVELPHRPAGWLQAGWLAK